VFQVQGEEMEGVAFTIGIVHETTIINQ